jgi:hypothetical protein
VSLRAGLAAALIGVLAPTSAGAFCRTTTTPVIADFQPSQTKCWDQGLPLFWRNACVGYSLQRDASRQVNFDDAANGLARAFARWAGATCPTQGPGRSRVSVDLRDLGGVECAEVAYNLNGPNQNVIMFRDAAWPHGDTANTIALTTVTFNPDTGEIYDADMEINTADKRVTLNDPVPVDGYDFDSIVTHEAGHFLGLAHSGDPRATMFGTYVPGASAMRELTSDDVAGICAAYRPAAARAVPSADAAEVPACDPSPRRGFTAACAEPPKRGCSGASGASSPAPGWAALGVALAGALMRRRSRRGV